MNLSIALGADALPADEEPVPEKRKQRWGGALMPPKKRKTNDFAHLYQHEKPFRPDWADQRPGSCPQLPLKPPGNKI